MSLEVKLTGTSLYMIYLPLRLYGVTKGDLVVSDYAISVLSCESSLLFPRYVLRNLGLELPVDPWTGWLSGSWQATYLSCERHPRT